MRPKAGLILCLLSHNCSNSLQGDRRRTELDCTIYTHVYYKTRVPPPPPVSEPFWKLCPLRHCARGSTHLWQPRAAFPTGCLCSGEHGAVAMGGGGCLPSSEHASPRYPSVLLAAARSSMPPWSKASSMPQLAGNRMAKPLFGWGLLGQVSGSVALALTRLASPPPCMPPASLLVPHLESSSAMATGWLGSKREECRKPRASDENQK